VPRRELEERRDQAERLATEHRHAAHFTRLVDRADAEMERGELPLASAIAQIDGELALTVVDHLRCASRGAEIRERKPGPARRCQIRAWRAMSTTMSDDTRSVWHPPLTLSDLQPDALAGGRRRPL
jgi:hypothetical protein